MKTIDVAIVIVNYNVRDLLRACLESLPTGTDGLSTVVYVVDSRSSDDSAAMVRRDFPQVRLIEATENRGYAYANNLALSALHQDRETSYRYVLLLNPDTVMPLRSLTNLIGFADERPELGAAGPRLLRPDGSMDLACRRSFPSPWVSFTRLSGLSKLFPRSRLLARYNLTFLDDGGVYEVDCVVGACMLVRWSAFEQVGLLDEDFFMYGEDLDWAFRMRRLGWRIVYNGRVLVFHHKGASSRQRSRQSILAFHEAMELFYRKHYADSSGILTSWLILSAIRSHALVMLLRRGSVSWPRWDSSPIAGN